MREGVPATATSDSHRTPVLLIVLVSYLMIVLDISVVITALPKIQHGLDLSPTGLSRVQNAYMLAFGGLLLLGARAGDILGRRRMFIIGLGIFTIASLVVGLAQSPSSLIGARALQGVGAAVDVLPRRTRAHARGRLLWRRCRRQRQRRACARRYPRGLDFLARRVLHQPADQHRIDVGRPAFSRRD
jgi:hypothetical protein